MNGIIEGKKKLPEAREITPYDMATPTGREPINIEFNISMKRPLKMPYPQKEMIHGQEYTNLVDEVQHNLSKFAVEWKRWPIPEHHVDKACEDMTKAIKDKFRELGLMK